MFDIKQSWKMSEPEKVLAIIKEVQVWRLSNWDGCACSRFSIRNVDINIACGKGCKRGVYVSSQSMDYDDDSESMRPIAEEVAKQVSENDHRGPVPVNLREWSRELDV